MPRWLIALYTVPYFTLAATFIVAATVDTRREFRKWEVPPRG